MKFIFMQDQRALSDVDGDKMGKYARSWSIVKSSFSMLNKDKHLLALPAMSLVCLGTSTAVLTFGVWQVHPIFGEQPRQAFEPAKTGLTLTPVTSVLLFLSLVLVTFLGMFFNAAMIIAANTRLNGTRPTIGGSLQGATRFALPLAVWAFISVTVSLLVRQLAQRFGFVGRLVLRFVGVAWSVATFLALPAIVIEGLQPKEALQRSGQLSKQTWGEQLIGNAMVSVIIGPIFFVLSIACLFSALFIGWASLGLLALVATTAGTIGMMTSNIYATCLFRYATTGEVPAGFGHDAIVGAFRPKGQKG